MPLSRTFGNQTVDEAQRERRIRRVFQAVAPRDDLMNDLMSGGGIHRLWKRRFVRLAAPQPGQRIVDLAGGTGDVAARMAGPGREVTAIDPSTAMMHVGQARGLESIRKFPDQRAFAGLVEAAGFEAVRWHNLSAGIACIHEARKPA